MFNINQKGKANFKFFLKACTLISSKLTLEEINIKTQMIQMNKLKCAVYQRTTSNDVSGPRIHIQVRERTHNSLNIKLDRKRPVWVI